ncbi:MAG: class I SAM-dependent methyltransferase, partial [Tepidiformaceae bacterium]
DAKDQDWSDEAFAARGIETAEQWWAALTQEPSIAPLIAERERQLATKERPTSTPIFDLHSAALRSAGFREVGTLWQAGSNRILLAVR